MRRERGFVLLIVLMGVGLLALFAAQLTGAARSDAVIAARLRDAAVTEAAAEGGVADALFALLTRAMEPGTVTETRVGGVRVSVRVPLIRPILAPNSDPPVVVATTLRDLGVDPALAPRLAAGIRSWHSVAPLVGFDDDSYRRAGRPYGSPRQPFGSPDEVGLVLGMTPDAFALIRPHLNVFGGGQGFADQRPGGSGVPTAGTDRFLTIVAEAATPTTRATRRAEVFLRDQPAPGSALFRVLDWSEDAQTEAGRPDLRPAAPPRK